MGLSSARTLALGVALLAGLTGDSSGSTQDRTPVGSDWRDLRAEAAAAALAARNLEADARLGAGEAVPGLLATPSSGQELAVTYPDWSFAPTVMPELVIPIQAIFLANDNGTEPCAIDANEVHAWVVRANQIWEPAGIRFQFDASVGSSDHFLLKSSLLNEIDLDTGPQWPAQLALASAYANLYPDRMVMFFRHGPGTSALGSGFSWTSLDFIVMPGFLSTGVCGVQNIGLMAHEIGHYLGLPHTFPIEYASYSAAEAAYAAGGSGPTNDVFEADGRDQTEPDPYIKLWSYQCDPGVTSVTFFGVTFELPKANVMSYYHPISEVVASQYNTARQTWAARTGKPMHELIFGGLTTYEAEHLGGSITGGFWSSQAMGPFLGKWSNDSHLVWLDGAIGDSMTLDFPVGGGGEYDVYVGLTGAPDFATLKPTINGTACSYAGLFASIVLPTGPVYLGKHTLPPGTSQLKLEVHSNDPRAAFPRQGAGVDYIVLAEPSLAHKETSRVGFPPNADVLKPGVFGGPIVGNVWAPYVDHTSFVTDALLDVLLVSGGSANWHLGLEGTVLVDLGFSLGTYDASPGLHYWFAIPFDPAFVGLTLYTQAGSLSAQGYFKLTNALDVTVGSY